MTKCRSNIMTVMCWQIKYRFFLLFSKFMWMWTFCVSVCAHINNPMNYVNQLFHYYCSMIMVELVCVCVCTSSSVLLIAIFVCFFSCSFDHLRRKLQEKHRQIIIMNNAGYSQLANGHCKNYCNCSAWHCIFAHSTILIYCKSVSVPQQQNPNQWYTWSVDIRKIVNTERLLSFAKQKSE